MHYFFTQDQETLLIRLLLAHIFADFIFQTKAVVQAESWLSKGMWLHVIVVFLATLLFSLSVELSLPIAILHGVIDGAKERILKKYQNKGYLLFLLNQIFHLLMIIIVWSWYFNLFGQCAQSFLHVITNYKISVYALSYSIVIWPIGVLLKFALQKLVPVANQNNVEHGGKLIGQF